MFCFLRQQNFQNSIDIAALGSYNDTVSSKQGGEHRVLGHVPFYFWSLVVAAAVGVGILWKMEKDFPWAYLIWAAANCGIGYLLFMA